MKSFNIILLVVVLIMQFSCKTQKHRIAYVNSYHKGYRPSDEIMKGISENLPADSFKLKIYFIDSKRQTSEEYLQEMVDSIEQSIIKFRPEVIIVSDDYAVAHFLKPFSEKSEIPSIFCGVNWSAEHYNLSYTYITGMLEVLPLEKSLAFIKKHFPSAVNLSIVSENSLSEQNNSKLLDTLYKNLGFEPVYLLADDFREWKEMFVRANEESDVIYLPTNGSVKNWNEEEAVAFVIRNTRKPTFTCDDFMMKYCIFGFTKIPLEQGEWAAKTTKKILNGVPPSRITITRNVKQETWFNTELANLIGFIPDSSWLKKAKIYQQAN